MGPGLFLTGWEESLDKGGQRLHLGYSLEDDTEDMTRQRA